MKHLSSWTGWNRGLILRPARWPRGGGNTSSCVFILRIYRHSHSVSAPPLRQFQLQLTVKSPMYCLTLATWCILDKWLEIVTWEKTIFFSNYFLKHNSLESGARMWNYPSGIVVWWWKCKQQSKWTLVKPFFSPTLFCQSFQVKVYDLYCSTGCIISEERQREEQYPH